MPILIMALLALIILGIIGILLVVAVIMEHSPAEHPARRHRPHPASFDVAPSSGANMDKPRAALVEPSLSAIFAAGIANTCTPGAAKSAGGWRPLLQPHFLYRAAAYSPPCAAANVLPFAFMR
jgi:hypothetical protein